MPRYTSEQLRQLEDEKRRLFSSTGATHTQGGFLPLAPLLPFAAAAATPLLCQAGSWLGHKIFGNGIGAGARSALAAGVPAAAKARGIARAGAAPPSMGQGTGLLRAGDKTPKLQLAGSGRSNYRSGDFPMPSMVPIPHSLGPKPKAMKGGVLMQVPGVPDKIKQAIRAITTVGGARPAGLVRAERLRSERAPRSSSKKKAKA